MPENSSAWPNFCSNDSQIDTLVKLSRYFGSNPDFVLAGGGNTSVKIGNLIFVKGSGHPLASIGADGFVEMRREPLAAIVTAKLSENITQREEQFKQAILTARVHPEKGQRPSVEVVLHELFPRQFVVHTHATLVNMLTCCKQGEELARELFQQQILWVPYVDPGYMLACALNEALSHYREITGLDCPKAVLMQNHGLIVCGDTPDEIRQQTNWLVDKIRQWMEHIPRENPFGPLQRLTAEEGRALINQIAPALRALLAEGEKLKVVTFSDAEEVQSLACGAEGRETVAGGPLTPDQIVYCKSFPLWFEPLAEEEPRSLVARLREAVLAHEAATHFPPKGVLVKGLGLFAIGDDYAAAQTVRDVTIDAIKVMAGARQLGGILYMTQRNREFIDHWEVESYRRKVSGGLAQAGRVAGKVAIVTGAAQGFGLEIAKGLAEQGAHVALMDINAEGVAAAALELNNQLGRPRALGLAMNVTSGASLAEAVHQVVRAFGGLDLLVSNAGVLRAESVKTQSEKDFDFVGAVNYKGYFLCVQKTAPIMAVQHLARPDLLSDIIQINSKSGLTGSNKNAAYAGSKFGGIGLTQSFAMELIEDGIKVNSICPGNFLGGPLWSDPNNGLFVQYLRTGKVPGARTIEDVKKAYEAKVPMRRGCTTLDVMRAIYYLVEQQYETGQAVPVTGGQVMLN